VRSVRDIRNRVEFRLDKRKKLDTFCFEISVLDFRDISSSVVFITPIFFKHVLIVSCWVHPMLSVNTSCAFAFFLISYVMCVSCIRGVLRCFEVDDVSPDN
jgi:hypothetical protein